MKNNKSLFSLSEFWLSILLPLSLSIVICIIIIVNSNLKLDPSYIGFNKFIDIFKLPLGVLALIFPLVALVASNHRSRQSAAQIEQGKSQNTFANFFKHKEAFHEMLERLEKRYDIVFFDTDMLYSKLFPNNSPASMTYNLRDKKIHFIDETRNSLLAILKESLVIGDSPIDGLDDSDLIKKFYEDLHGVSKELNFKCKSGIYLCWKRKYKNSDGSIKEISVVPEQRIGIHLGEYYVFSHVSLCDEVMRKLSEFCLSEKYIGAYAEVGSPLWIWEQEEKIKEAFKNCKKFGDVKDRYYAGA